jgi:hypothetical protein
MAGVSDASARQREGAPRRRGATAQGGDRAVRVKTTRVPLHLGAEVAKRLGVHCALAGRDRSAEATRILGAWLRTSGKGQKAFQPDDQVPGDTDPDAGEEAPAPV